jgi:hypothetical protein
MIISGFEGLRGGDQALCNIHVTEVYDQFWVFRLQYCRLAALTHTLHLAVRIPG